LSPITNKKDRRLKKAQAQKKRIGGSELAKGNKQHQTNIIAKQRDADGSLPKN
jgi:hypothetical protein